MPSRIGDRVVCVLCGRIGTRGFVILSGDGRRRQRRGDAAMFGRRG